MITTINEWNKFNEQELITEEYILVKGENIIKNFTDKTKALDAFKQQGKPSDGRPSNQISVWKRIK